MSRIKVTRGIDKSTRHGVFEANFKFDSVYISIMGLILSISAAASIISLDSFCIILGCGLNVPFIAGRISVSTKYTDSEKNTLQNKGTKLGIFHGFSIFICEFGLALFIFSVANQKMLWIISISFLCIGIFILLEIWIKKKFLKIYNSIQEKDFLEKGQYSINKFIKNEALIGNLKLINVIVGDFDKSIYNKNENNIYIKSTDNKDKETFILALSRCFQQAICVKTGMLYSLTEFGANDEEVTDEDLFDNLDESVKDMAQNIRKQKKSNQ